MREVTSDKMMKSFVPATCRVERLGGRTAGRHVFGSWWVCADMLTADSVVFSVGIASDVTFDVAVARRFGAHVWSCDPTITRADFWSHVAKHNLTNATRSHIRFLPFGLDDADDVLEFYKMKNRKMFSTKRPPAHSRIWLPEPVLRAPVLSLESLLFVAAGVAARSNARGPWAALSGRAAASARGGDGGGGGGGGGTRLGAARRGGAGRSDFRVDVLKVDIEGSEYEVLDSGVRRWVRMRSPPRQISVELHESMWKGSYRGKNARLIKTMAACGYDTRHVDEKDQTWLFILSRPPSADCVPRDGAELVSERKPVNPVAVE